VHFSAVNFYHFSFVSLTLFSGHVPWTKLAIGQLSSAR